MLRSGRAHRNKLVSSCAVICVVIRCTPCAWLSLARGARQGATRPCLGLGSLPLGGESRAKAVFCPRDRFGILGRYHWIMLASLVESSVAVASRSEHSPV